MARRNSKVAAQTVETLGSTLDDLATTVAAAAGPQGRKAKKLAARGFSAATEAAQGAAKQVHSATKEADVEGKATAAGAALQMLGKRASGIAHQSADGGLNINIDPNDIPRLLRGATLLASGLGTVFAPGSPLDASRQEDGAALLDGLSEQARQGVNSAATVTQQRIKEIVDVGRDALSALSESLTAAVEAAESSLQEALDETESRLTSVTDQAAEAVREVLPAPKKAQGGVGSFLFLGLLIGGLVAFLSSPLSGPLGERIANLRRDLGLGGDAVDESQYWPSPPQDTTATATAAATPNGAAVTADGGDRSPLENKTEQWSESGADKTDKDESNKA